MRQTFLTGILALACLAVAQPGAQGQETIAIVIDKKAELVDGGAAADLTVAIACPAGLQVLEAFAYIVQDDNSSDFGFIPLVCDGDAHEFVVHIPALPDGPLLHRGKARATVFVLLEDPNTGDTVSAEESRRIKLR